MKARLHLLIPVANWTMADQAEAHARLGGSLLSEKKYAEAEAAYRNAVRLAPQSAAYRVGLGICFQYQ